MFIRLGSPNLMFLTRFHPKSKISFGKINIYVYIYLLFILCHLAQSCWLLYTIILDRTAFAVYDECEWLILFAFNAIIMLLNIDKDLSEIKLIPLD